MLTEEKTDITITQTDRSRLTEIDFNNLKFGREFSDHMFVAKYENGKWGNAEIVPFEHITMSPATSVIHYGQSIFEGMKAYRTDDGQVTMFRPEDNITRMNQSAERMCMPAIPPELFREGLMSLIKLDAGWVPDIEGGSLYIRPFMFATDEYIGVKPSDSYKFMIFTCPVGNYYTEPVKVKIETVFSRACEGGVGRAKAAGNYAAALYPAKKAQEAGYHQLIWTDAKEHKYIEESGTMNIMFMIDGKLMTPPLSGSILPGITRMSVLQVARDWGIEVVESSIHVDTVISALEEGRLSDAFGVGTAATIAQIELIGYKGKDYMLPDPTQRDFSNKIYKYMDDLKRGRVADKYSWNVQVH